MGQFTIPVRAPNTPGEKRKVVETIVDRYKKKHKGKGPTVNWINQRLQEQGQTFAVEPDAPRSSASIVGGGVNGATDGIWNDGMDLDIRGTALTNNGVAIDNHGPAKVRIVGSDVSGNKTGIRNTPSDEPKPDAPK
jgi:hypothetical protein